VIESYGSSIKHSANSDYRGVSSNLTSRANSPFKFSTRCGIRRYQDHSRLAVILTLIVASFRRRALVSTTHPDFQINLLPKPKL